MEDFRLKNAVNRLSDEVDSLAKLVHNLRQQQLDMLEQIKYLKGKMTDDAK